MPNEQETTQEGTPSTTTTDTTGANDGDQTNVGEAGASEANGTLIGNSDGEGEGAGEQNQSFGEAIDADALTLPEGVTLNETQSEEFLGLVNGAENRTDLANSILKMYAEVSLKAHEAATLESNETVERISSDWRNEIKADPEFGGKNEAESLAKANVLVEKYGNRDFANALNITGMGNNLQFLRFLMSVEKDLPQQATPATGNPAAGSKSLADRLFASSET